MSATVLAEWSPNDWPESLAELRTIDNLLRCSICFEYFNIAVTIPECSHNYCSLCIRRSLNYETQCPTCSTKATERDLKNNRVLDQLVKSFVKIRSKLLEVVSSHKNHSKNLNENAQIKDQQTTSSCSEKTERKREKTSPLEAMMLKKRKRMKLDDQENKASEPLVPSVGKDHDETASNASSVDSDLMIVEVKTPKSQKQPAIKKKSQSPKTASCISSKDMAECPVCGEFVMEKAINSHLDDCLMRSEKKEVLRSRRQSSSRKAQGSGTTEGTLLGEKSSTENEENSDDVSSMSGNQTVTTTTSTVAASNSFINPIQKRKTLPKLVYTLLSDKQLRQKLKEFHLPTQGTRENLIKRHQEFVIFYNSQCESTNPKSVAQIAREVEKQEKTRLKLSLTNSSSTVGTSSMRSQAEDEREKARVQCLKNNEEDFEKLISDIRKRIKGKKIEVKKKKIDADRERQSSDPTEDPADLPSNSAEMAISSHQPQSNTGSNTKHNVKTGIPVPLTEDDPPLSDPKEERTADEKAVGSFSIVPDPPSSDSLASLGDDDCDSNLTPSLGLGAEQEIDEIEGKEDESGTDDGCSPIDEQSLFEASGVIPESPVIDCSSNSRPEGKHSDTDENMLQEWSPDEEQPKRSRRLKLKSNLFHR